MSKKTTIDISNFGQVAKALASISGESFKRVIKTEAGHILANATTGTKKASIAKIVKRTIPQGWKYGKHTGGQMVTEKDGFKYHVGLPIPGQGVNGSDYAFPITRWMRRRSWNEFIFEQEQKVKDRLKNRGLGASQFYHMATMLGLPLPKQPPKYIRKSHLKKIVQPYLKPRIKGEKTAFEIRLESKGLRVSKGVGAQRVLMLKTKGSITNFKNGIKKQLFNDMKFKTSRYPLLFI